MFSLSRAGRTCLLLGPLGGLASVLIARTESLDVADLAAAFTGQPVLTHLGYAVNAVGTVLMAAGVLWLAWRAYDHSRRLAVIGGILGFIGLFSVTVDDAVHLSGSLVVSGMTPAQAALILHRLTTGGIVLAGVLSELLDVGMILLAIAVLRLGVQRWASALVALGAVVEAIGFAAGSRYLAAVGFALTFAGLAAVVRMTLGSAPATPRRAPAGMQPA